MSDVVEVLLYLYAESPVHAGGADSIGALDLPVQREATTGYPAIWGQSLKGALRQAAGDAKWSTDLVTEVFGSGIEESRGEEDRGDGEPDGEAGGRQLRAGSLTVGDAQVVAMPVPTLRRTFAWVTSDLALNRLRRKYAVLPDPHRTAPASPQTRSDAGVAAHDQWLSTAAPPQPEVLGPCLVQLGSSPDAGLTAWADRIARDALGNPDLFGQLAEKLRTDLLLVGSSVMPTLLRECTEFVARVQLDGDKTVQHGPFYSEYLPTETILAASLSLRPTRDDPQRQREHHRKVTELLHGTLVQVGGDETIGKGLMWARLVGGAA